jgi:hypothetical protein
LGKDWNSILVLFSLRNGLSSPRFGGEDIPLDDSVFPYFAFYFILFYIYVMKKELYLFLELEIFLDQLLFDPPGADLNIGLS